MIRVILIQTGLFLLPFVLYGAFLALRRSPVLANAHWTPGVVIALAAASLLLIIGGFLVFGQLGANPPGETYVPPRYEDGVYIPGHFVPRSQP